MRILHADAIFTGDNGVLSGGAILVDESGEVKELAKAEELLPRHAGVAIERVHGVLMPGLVNAHTHLELSALRGQVPAGGGFVKWVNAMMPARAKAQPEADAAAIETAVREVVGFCTAAVGDITNSLAAVAPMAKAGLQGSVFHEIFGLLESSFDENLARAERAAEAIHGTLPASLSYSRVPHTLYTTHAQGVRKLVEQARAARSGPRRLSVHLSEHDAERGFLESGEGLVADWFVRQFGLSAAELGIPRMSPVHFAETLGLLTNNTLLVHLTDARRDEFELVAKSGAHVVLCPRSNRYIEERLPLLDDVLDAGIEPALGTDSLASNLSLDVLEEAATLDEAFRGTPAAQLLRMATWNGAQALGLPHLGRIAKGARPGLWAVRGAFTGDPAAFVLAQRQAPREWLVPPGLASTSTSNERVSA